MVTKLYALATELCVHESSLWEYTEQLGKRKKAHMENVRGGKKKCKSGEKRTAACTAALPARAAAQNYNADAIINYNLPARAPRLPH